MQVMIYTAANCRCCSLVHMVLMLKCCEDQRRQRRGVLERIEQLAARPACPPHRNALQHSDGKGQH